MFLSFYRIIYLFFLLFVHFGLSVASVAVGFKRSKVSTPELREADADADDVDGGQSTVDSCVGARYFSWLSLSDYSYR